jgi:hypothetical protein
VINALRSPMPCWWEVSPGGVLHDATSGQVEDAGRWLYFNPGSEISAVSDVKILDTLKHQSHNTSS